MLCSTTQYSGRVKLGSFMSQSCKQQLRNEQKCAMHVQSCFFAKLNLSKGLNPEVISKVGWVWSSGWTFNVVLNNLLLFCCCKNSLLLWSRNFATKVTWRHTSPLYWAYFYWVQTLDDQQPGSLKNWWNQAGCDLRPCLSSDDRVWPCLLHPSSLV